MRFEFVKLIVARHAVPIDAVDEFAPADDLANEPFHRSQGGQPRTISGDCGVEALLRS